MATSDLRKLLYCSTCQIFYQKLICVEHSSIKNTTTKQPSDTLSCLRFKKCGYTRHTLASRYQLWYGLRKSCQRYQLLTYMTTKHDLTSLLVVFGDLARSNRSDRTTAPLSSSNLSRMPECPNTAYTPLLMLYLIFWGNGHAQNLRDESEGPSEAKPNNMNWTRRPGDKLGLNIDTDSPINCCWHQYLQGRQAVIPKLCYLPDF